MRRRGRSSAPASSRNSPAPATPASWRPVSGRAPISPASLASWSSPPVTVGASWRGSPAPAGTSSSRGWAPRRRGRARTRPAPAWRPAASGARPSGGSPSGGPASIGATAPPLRACPAGCASVAAAAGVGVPLDRRLGDGDRDRNEAGQNRGPRAGQSEAKSSRIAFRRPSAASSFVQAVLRAMLLALCAPLESSARLAWGAVAIGIVTPLVRHRLKLRPPVVSALSWPAPAALALAQPRSPLRDAGIWTLQMWAYFAHFDMPDDDPDALLRRLRVDYPIRVDRALGLGTAPDHPPTARARARGPCGAAGVRPVGDPLDLVPGATRDARLHPAATPRALPALGGDDGRLLRPRVRRLLAGPDRAAVVGRCERQHAAGAPHHGRGRRAFLATPLAAALPFVARQSVCSHALTPFRYVGDGRSHPVAGRARPCSPRVGLRADPRIRPRLPGRALRDRPARRPGAGRGHLARGAPGRARWFAQSPAPCSGWSLGPADADRGAPPPRRAPARAPRRGARARAGLRGGRGLRRRRVRRRVPGAAGGPPQAARRPGRRRAAGVRDLRRLPEAGRPRRRRPQARQRGLVLDRHRDRVQRGRVRRLRRPLPGHPRRHARRPRAPAPRPQGVVPDHDGRAGGHAHLLGRRRRRDRADLLGAAQGGHAAPARGLPDGRLHGAHLRRLHGRADRVRDPAAHPRPARRRPLRRHGGARRSSRRSSSASSC